MYSEPGHVNALGSHLRIFLQKDNEENEDLLAIQPKKALRYLWFLLLVSFL
jgi:hypothetical protein